MQKKFSKNNYTTFEEYVNNVYLPRKKREVKLSTYTRYCGIMKRIVGALGHIPLNKITKCDVSSFYDDLHEAKNEQIIYKPQDLCIRLLKLKYTRPEIVSDFGIGMGTVDALRAGKNVSEKTAKIISDNLNVPISNLFRKKEFSLSERTILHHHRLLFNVFREAEYDGLIDNNIMKSVRPPRLTSNQEVRCLDKGEAFCVLQALQSYAEYPYRELLQLIFYTGLRRGEACGLEWRDIDLKNHTISVNRASYYLPEKGIYTDTPKTKQSIRTLAIGEKTEKILKNLWIYQKKMFMKPTEKKRIFTTPNGDTLNPNSVTRYFHRFVDKYDLPACSVHTLRHTNASLLVSENLPITAVSKRLGHSNSEITFRYYVHSISEDNKTAAEKIENLF